MQHLKTHLRWIQSFRRLQISGVLLLILVSFALIYATMILITKEPETAKAQTTPVTTQLTDVEEAQEQPVELAEEVAKPTTSKTQPTQQSAPAPKPAAQPVAKPAPAKKTAQPAQSTKQAAPAYDKVSISSIGLSSKYVAVGLTSKNAIDVDPTLVGWWNGSAQPGTPGTVFLDGHNPGVFSKLPDIKIGAQISLSKANGESFNYKVVHTETVQLAGINMRKALSAYDGAKEGLNIMTCVGTYNKDTGTTDQRFVVYAVRA